VHALSVSEAMAKVPCVGASGAISAVLGACVVYFSTCRVKCLLFLLFRPVYVNVSAFLFVGLWFLIHLLNAYLSGGAISGVAYWAHIGGFLFGLVFTVGWNALMELTEIGEAREPQAVAAPALLEPPVASEEEMAPETIETAEAFEDHGADVEALLQKGEIDLALERYAALEEKGLPGSLSPAHQRTVADTLLSRGLAMLGARALFRLRQVSEDPEESARLNARLGLLFIDAFDNKVEGRRFLE
jgi:hypothetical protein